MTRRAADAVRRARRSRAGDAAFAAEAAEAVSNSDEMEARAAAPSVARALAALPAGQRATVALFYLEDLSVAEVAAALGVPAGTVKTRLMAAREKLRLALGANNGD